MKLNIERVITHNGTFHADDVFAVAMLRVAGYRLTCWRTRGAEVISQALANPTSLVLDVGGEYNPSLANFDHHQDKNLPSAAGLLYAEIKDELCPPEVQPYFFPFIEAIDAMDTNRGNVYELLAPLPKGLRNTASIIGGFNRDPADDAEQDQRFDQAVQFASMILRNELHAAGKRMNDDLAYEKRMILSNNVAVFDEYSSVWIERGDHMFAVMRHSTGWQVISRDAINWNIPEHAADHRGFRFRHFNGFMAVFTTWDTAVNFALTLPTGAPNK